MKYHALALLFIALTGLTGCKVHTSGTLDSSFEVLSVGSLPASSDSVSTHAQPAHTLVSQSSPRSEL